MYVCLSSYLSVSPHQGTPGAPGAPGTTGPPGKQAELGPPVSHDDTMVPPGLLGLHLRPGTSCYDVFPFTCVTGGRKSCQSGLAERLSAGLTASCLTLSESQPASWTLIRTNWRGNIPTSFSLSGAISLIIPRGILWLVWTYLSLYFNAGLENNRIEDV